MLWKLSAAFLLSQALWLSMIFRRSVPFGPLELRVWSRRPRDNKCQVKVLYNSTIFGLFPTIFPLKTHVTRTGKVIPFLGVGTNRQSSPHPNFPWEKQPPPSLRIRPIPPISGLFSHPFPIQQLVFPSLHQTRLPSLPDSRTATCNKRFARLSMVRKGGKGLKTKAVVCLVGWAGALSRVGFW